MFQSGAGLEVLENKGFMTTRVYLPWQFIVNITNSNYNYYNICIVIVYMFWTQNRTRGLFGNWSFDQFDDFTLPNGMLVQPNTYDFEAVHKQYAINCKCL